MDLTGIAFRSDYRQSPHALLNLIAELSPLLGYPKPQDRHKYSDGILESLMESLIDGTEAHRRLYDPKHRDQAVMDRLELYRPRIAISAEVTKSGNLSVRVHPLFFGEDGRWQLAPEWRREDGISSRQNEFERPANEILFIREAEILFHRHERGTYSRPTHERERRLKAEAVRSAFYFACEKLADNFEVAIIEDLRLTEDPDPCEPQLEIVDTRKLKFASVIDRIAGLKRRYGYDAHEFHKVFSDCYGNEYSDDYFNSAKASRRLRTAEGLGSDLTPGTVAVIAALLKQGENCGVYQPARYVGQVRPPSRLRASKDANPKPPHGSITAPPRRIARNTGLLPGRTERPADRELSYAGLRVAPLPPEIAEEFGVKDAMEMVERINDIYRARGESLLPYGNFPSGAAKLRGFVNLYRAEIQASAPKP